ncbi:MAG TPA: aminotransferase class I/II-fold pyridoxal phosphate-dependent enzyme [Candidatus Polarisedimenticolaceae bacterium]|nr:aminotransferase class I/II-fold pyridoxal phosphate-dependent enzyme [Candidatus Polarisedimenticolaceae bacterium]
MPDKTLMEMTFGPSGRIDEALSEGARSLIGSEILKIAAEIRTLVASGKQVCNLTVGDFNPRYFPIPAALLEEIHGALTRGETNYPPSDGMMALRQAAADITAREYGVRYPIESVLIASGSRPILYGAYRCVVNPGDVVVYPAPSWNNNHYCVLTQAKAIDVPTRAAEGFQPTLADLAPHLGAAQMVVLNTPLNPSGTAMQASHLKDIAKAIVAENEKRAAAGRRPVFLLFDQVYGSLTFRRIKHEHPAALVPEIAPWLITVDGISKGLAATGLRVGWLLAAPDVTARMRDLIGHVGAWAPRAEQVATAKFLQNEVAVHAFRKQMNAALEQRLEALYEGFSAMKADGFPVDCIQPQGAIYLSLQLDIVGKTIKGKRIATNEEIRRLILEEAGLAAVPFQAFGLMEETGWFRLSVGAVSMDEIAQMLPRLRELLG